MGWWQDRPRGHGASRDRGTKERQQNAPARSRCLVSLVSLMPLVSLVPLVPQPCLPRVAPLPLSSPGTWQCHPEEAGPSSRLPLLPLPGRVSLQVGRMLLGDVQPPARQGFLLCPAGLHSPALAA